MGIAAGETGSTEAHATQDRPARFAAAVICVTLASWLPVLVGATSRAVAGWVAAVALAVAVEWLTRRFTPAVLVGGLFAASALVPSGLVTDATRYMPIAVTGGALSLRVALDAWRGRRLSSPLPRSVLLVVGLYLAWAALTTVTAADRRVSAVYLAGMILVCGLAFWAIPTMLTKQSDRDSLLATLGVLGVLVAVSVYLVSVVVHISVFGREIGDYQLADLTIGGHPTGLLFGRSSGIDLAPLEAAILMAVGLGALLGWSSSRSGRPLLLARLGIAFLIPAILITLSRSAWLTAIVSAGLFAVLAFAAKLPVKTAAIAFIVLASAFLLVFVGAVGANAVASSCTANCSASGGDETPLRGATGLSGREYLWQASVLAIKSRPVLGFGPGNNVPALIPYLGGGGVHIQGLTSHSTWLRTGVEMGIPGLALLLGVIGAVAWMFMEGLRAAIPRDPVHLALAATVCGLLPAMTFESFLLGGVTFSNLYLTLGLGLVAAPLMQAAVSAPATHPAAV